MFEDNIARGVALLDRVQPDWLSLIQLHELNLRSACDCVLGQVERRRPGGPRTFATVNYGYDVFKERMGWNDLDALRHGFALLHAHDDAWDTLTQEWRDTIHALRRERGDVGVTPGSLHRFPTLTRRVTPAEVDALVTQLTRDLPELYPLTRVFIDA